MDSGGVSLKTWVEVPFADGTYRFELRIGQIKELQENCNSGIGAIYRRLASHDFYAEDILETLRLGLIGGGVEANKAARLVNRYAQPPFSPLSEVHGLALSVVSACVVGIPLGKDQAAMTTPLDASISLPSTVQVA